AAAGAGGGGGGRGARSRVVDAAEGAARAGIGHRVGGGAGVAAGSRRVLGAAGLAARWWGVLGAAAVAARAGGCCGPLGATRVVAARVGGTGCRVAVARRGTRTGRFGTSPGATAAQARRRRGGTGLDFAIPRRVIVRRPLLLRTRRPPRGAAVRHALERVVGRDGPNRVNLGMVGLGGLPPRLGRVGGVGAVRVGGPSRLAL